MFARRVQIWQALILRDIRTRRGESPYDYLITLGEPIGQIAFITAVFELLDRRADFGSSLLLFLMSGVLPYFLFTHVTARVIGSVRAMRGLLPLPQVAPIDLAISRLILEAFSVILITLVMFFAVWAVDVPGARPRDLIEVVFATTLTALTAFGVGLTVGCLAVYSGLVRLAWTLISRSLIFFSSVFYVVDFLHDPASRELLWWNPLMHAVVWFRAGVYDGYPVNSLSKPFLIVFCFLSILLGLALERAVRRRA